MTNLIKVSVSQSFRTQIFEQTGQIIPSTIEGNVKFTPEQAKILAKTDPIQNAISKGKEPAEIDFRGNSKITSFSTGFGSKFLYFNANTQNIDEAVVELCKSLEEFQEIEKNDKKSWEVAQKLKAEQAELKTQELNKKKLENREEYLNNEEKAKKLIAYNASYFDSETLEYLQKVKDAEKTKDEAEKSAKVEEFKKWCLNNGSEKLKLRVELGYKYIDLAACEYATKYLGVNAEWKGDDDDFNTINKPSLQQLRFEKSILKTAEEKGISIVNSCIEKNEYENSFLSLEIKLPMGDRVSVLLKFPPKLVA